MIIPDCRTDNSYNEAYLNAEDKQFIKGYDYAVEQVLTMFDNLDVYPAIEPIFQKGIADIGGDKVERTVSALDDWLEVGRNEAIVSMIDSMSREDYAEARNEVRKKTD